MNRTSPPRTGSRQNHPVARQRWRGWPAGVVLPAMLLLGCTQPVTSEPCGVLLPAEIQAALGVAVGPPEPTLEITGCSWELQHARSLDDFLLVFVAPAETDVLAADGGGVPLEGIGDAAVLHVGDSLFVRKGARDIVMRWRFVPFVRDPVFERNSVVSLMKKVVERLA